MLRAIELIKKELNEHIEDGLCTDYETASNDDEFYNVGCYETLYSLLRQLEKIEYGTSNL